MDVCIAAASLLLASSFLEEKLGVNEAFGEIVVGLDINSGKATGIFRSNFDKSKLGIAVEGYPKIRVIVVDYERKLPERLYLEFQIEERAFGSWIGVKIAMPEHEHGYICTSADPIKIGVEQP